jgi:hypothetical protein
MVSNGPQAISALDNDVEVIMPTGEVIASLKGAKETVAARILAIIEERLINKQLRPEGARYDSPGRSPG